MRWAFWRSSASESQRPLPDDVGIPTRPHASAAAADDHDQDSGGPPASRTSGAAPSATAQPTPHQPPLTAPTPDLDPETLAGTGPALVRAVTAVRTGSLLGPVDGDVRALAVAATAALAARLPALSGTGVVLDEPEDEQLHAYADLLVSRAEPRGRVDREDLLAVAHLAAAAAAVGAADEPALLLLAGVPPDDQLAAAALLLAQTAVDGGGSPEDLDAEVRELFQG